MPDSKAAFNKPIRFEALTGIRCVAACMIFVYHNKKYWRDALNPHVNGILNEFHMGVSLFFVLSGFLIAYTYGQKPLESTRDYVSYIIRRLARIFPLYWLILTLYYLDARFGNYHFSWLTYTLIHGFSERHNLDAIAQAWSLTVEMSYYFIAPFLVLLVHKRIAYGLTALVLLFLVFWGLGLCWQHINNNPQAFFAPVTFLINGTFAGQSLLFFAGLALAVWIRKKGDVDLRRLPYKTVSGILGISAVIAAMVLLHKDIYDQGNHHSIGIMLQLTFLPAFVALLLAGLMYERTWLQIFLSTRLMVMLGNASFSFYLIHISYVNLKLKSHILLPDRNFTLMWLMSIALYYLFEKPVYAVVRRYTKG